MNAETQAETLVTGRYWCGAIRYRSSAGPLARRMCWCRDCQYLAAGNATVNVCFATSTFVIEGKLSDYQSIAASGNVMHRRFCSTCGTPMFSEAASRPHLIFVRAGTLDDSRLASPEAVIWTSSAPQWACIDERLPRVTHQPPPL